MITLTNMVEICRRPQKICGPLEHGGYDLKRSNTFSILAEDGNLSTFAL
ncbi:hypothetical protein CPEBRM1_ABPJDJAI_01838 [Companilactobacillus paralimentarius]